MFAIHIEASHAKGMGHLYRMLNFSDTLADRGVPFRFLVNSDKVSESILAQRGLSFDVVRPSPRPDWQACVVREHGIQAWIDDRLDTDMSHAVAVKDCGIPRVTLDDRGPGALLADLNIVAMSFNETEKLTGARVLRGPKYLVLNREIGRYRRLRTEAGSIVLTMGGADTYGVTCKVARALKSAGRNATVILGPAFQHEAELSEALDESFVLKRHVDSLIEEFSNHAVAITGGGITAFEANASGLPCVVIANEEFEVPVGQAIARLGGALFAGHHSEFDAAALSASMPIERMSRAALESFDLNGAARVADEIEALL